MKIDGYGRVAIVTGGASGLGLAISKTFIEEGKRVAIVDINQKALDRLQEDDFFMNAMSNVIFIHADVSIVEDIKNCVQMILSKWKRIDILVNNAGIRLDTPIENINPDEWNKVLSINLGSTFFFSQQVMKVMKEQEWGRIINISSVAGQFATIFPGAHYSASKAGQIQLTKVFAKSLAPHGVTVNAIATALLRRPGMDPADIEQLENQLQYIPVGRFGEAAEVARLVSFLASESGDYITGATFDINGGMYMR